MAKLNQKGNLQRYPRELDNLLSSSLLYPVKSPALSNEDLDKCITEAFIRCTKNKKGELKPAETSPDSLVNSTIKHLKERSDPILNPYFISLLDVDDIFELDAVSYEMQRHRMTIGVFYQYLILELMRKTWAVFDGSREGDIVADIDTPTFEPGIRLYMSIKKSKDTVGGQDIGGVIRRLEHEAINEKNLTRPYLCIVGIATPPKGKLRGYEDRTIKTDKSGNHYSLNCEFWGPGFIFPYISGHEASEIYRIGIKKVADYLPFLTIKFRNECSDLLKYRLDKLGLIDSNNKIILSKYLDFLIEK